MDDVDDELHVCKNMRHAAHMHRLAVQLSSTYGRCGAHNETACKGSTCARIWSSSLLVAHLAAVAYLQSLHRARRGTHSGRG